MKKPRFKYYDGFPLEPIYSMWLERGYSDVSGQTLLSHGHPIPPTPTYRTWRDLVRSKRKCGRCFSTVKNSSDLVHHNETNHLNVPIQTQEINQVTGIRLF